MAPVIPLSYAREPSHPGGPVGEMAPMGEMNGWLDDEETRTPKL